MHELMGVYQGTVQGVFFRKTLQDHARKWNLSGYAKNLSDGSVEVCAQGEKEDLLSFIKKVEDEPGRALISGFTYDLRKASKSLKGFSIL